MRCFSQFLAFVAALVLAAGMAGAEDRAATSDKAPASAPKAPASKQAQPRAGEAPATGAAPSGAPKRGESSGDRAGSDKPKSGAEAADGGDAPADGGNAPKQAAAPGDGKAPANGAAPASDASAPAGGASASGAEAGRGRQPAAIDGATYVVRLRDLEQRIDELKEQIRRSHTRLSLLSETILSSGIGAARAEIRFLNDMSSAFRLTKAVFVLDGAVQYSREDDTGAMTAQKEIPIFSGSIPPGDHTLQVLVQHKGHGYGVFSYLRGYNFEVKATHSFTVTEGKLVELEVIAWEKGGITTPLEQRPSVRFRERILNASGAELSVSDKPSSEKGRESGGR